MQVKMQVQKSAPSLRMISGEGALVRYSVLLYSVGALSHPLLLPLELFIERNQKLLAPEITLAVTHHDRQKQVEVKRSNRVNPHEIRLFSGCPYAVVK